MLQVQHSAIVEIGLLRAFQMLRTAQELGSLNHW